MFSIVRGLWTVSTIQSCHRCNHAVGNQSFINDYKRLTVWGVFGGHSSKGCIVSKSLMENQYNTMSCCKECSDKLKGRADKLFCNDACRSAFNNRKNRAQLDPLKSINRVLIKNRKILKEVYETTEGKNTVSIRRLENKGFLFNFFTHTEEPQSGNCYRYCYEFGYAEAKNGELMITKYPGTYL